MPDNSSSVKHCGRDRKNTSRSRYVRPGRYLTGLALMAAAVASGQDALRTSLAQESIGDKHLRDLDNHPFTVAVGDLKLLLSSSLQLDYNDNIFAAPSAKQDWILRPRVRAQGFYPLTENNTLEFAVGIGYDQYFQHDAQSGVQLDTDSGTSFSFQVKDFTFNLHERFTYSRDTASQSQLANISQFENFNNTIGGITSWDLGDFTPSLGYDHVNNITSGNGLPSRDRVSEMVLARTAFRIHPELTAGLEGTGTFTSYDPKVLNDSSSYTVGAYLTWKPDKYITVSPRAGYSMYLFDQTAQNVRTADVSSWYADLNITHQVTETLSYGIDAGRETQVGLTSDVVQDYFVRPSVSWSGFYNFTTTVFFSYEDGTQGLGDQIGNQSEKYDYYSAGVNLGYPIMKKMTASVNYRITSRSSNLPGRDYTQNLIGLRLDYQF